MIIKSQLLEKFSELINGISTRVIENSVPPFFFNMSFNVGDNEEKVKQNRQKFFKSLSLNPESVASLNQVHGKNIEVVTQGGNAGEADALITKVPGIALAVTIADCVPILIYDSNNKIISAVHSGWRGTEKKILQHTIRFLKGEFNSVPENLFAYIGPCISVSNYEVDNVVASYFGKDYVIQKNGKYYLDLKKTNYQMMLDEGLLQGNIEVSELCTFNEKDLLHSFRRDGNLSGRSLAVISMRKNNG